ncbi:MAG: methionyl-tRNA formyltransferase [Acidimicrobiia bacterium]|nr:methionyl-tRNA formyltransferase [Acidimicrobiia bacterium]
MRAAFLGTPAAAVPSLAALMEVAAVEFVVTQPDRPRGRGRSVEASPVKLAAQEWGLQVHQPRRDDELLELFVGTNLDVAVVVAYGRILRPDVLATTDAGFVNVHFSLLPRWRGAAPVSRAILAGDDYTGVSLMVLDEGMDTGPVFAVAESAINEYETAGQVTGRLASLGADVLRDHLDDYLHERLRPARQMATGATEAPRLTTAEAHLDLSLSPTGFARAVRAFNPRPGAWLMAEGHRIKVFEVGPATPFVEPGVIEIINGRPILGLEHGAVELVELQPAGKAPLSGRAWANGRRGEGLVVDEAPG